mgnify:CR=1 FL=1
MLKVIGIILIIGGSGGYGIARAVRLYRQLRQLRELLAALELLKCELNYTLLPLPELCSVTAKRSRGEIRTFFTAFGSRVELGRRHAAEEALEESRLNLPSDAAMALLELCETLGRYDMDGENRMLRLSAQRIQSAQARCESEKRQMARSCAALAVCAGIALAILML